MRRQSLRLGLRVAPAIAWCEKVSVPVVVAVVRPIVLLPTAAATGLSPQQLEALIMHELAHIRRYDLLVNLMQRLVESMLFFHPAVWYVSRRISSEREQACDEMVLATGCERTLYADSLVRMAELSASLRGIAAPAGTLAASGTNPSEFKRRVLNVMGVQPASNLRPGRLALLLVVIGTVISVTLPVALRRNSSTATAQAADSGQDERSQRPGGDKQDDENKPTANSAKPSREDVLKLIRGLKGSVRFDEQKPTVRLIELSGPGVTDEVLGKLTVFPELVTLSLRGNTKLSSNGLAALQEFPNLWILGLSSTAVTNEGLAHLSGLKKLEYLTLNMQSLTDDALKHVATLPNLKEFTLWSDCQVL